MALAAVARVDVRHARSAQIAKQSAFILCVPCALSLRILYQKNFDCSTRAPYFAPAMNNTNLRLSLNALLLGSVAVGV
jgi:hypothetical protein